MKTLQKSLLALVLVLGALVARSHAGSYLEQVYDGWHAGVIYSVPAGANVEADAIGNGSWAQTQVGGGGVGPGGTGVNLVVGYGGADYWIGNTAYADNIYYNVSAGGSGAESLVYVGW